MEGNKKLLAYFLLLFCLAAAASLPFYTFALDEYVYMNLAEEIKAGKYLQSARLDRAPLWPFLLAGAYQAFGSSELAAKLLSIIVALAGAAIVYLAVKRHFGEREAMAALLVYGVNPFFVFFSGRAFSEPLFMTLMAACLYFLWESEKNSRSLVFLGLSAGLMVLARYFGLAFLPVFAALLFYKHGWKLLLSKHAWLGLAAFLLVLSPYFYASFLATGDPFGPMAYFVFGVAKATVEQHPGGVPDRIANYFLLFPLVLAFSLLPLAAALLEKRKTLIQATKRKLFAEKNFKLLSLAVGIAAFLAILEFGIKLKELRYALTLLPLLAVAAGIILGPKMAGQKSAGSSNGNYKKLFYAALVLNAFAAFALAAYFGLFYEKQVNNAKGGVFLAENCLNGTVFSNAQDISIHYTGKHNAVQQADCLFLTGYEPQGNESREINKLAASNQYALAYQAGEVKVFKKVS